MSCEEFWNQMSGSEGGEAAESHLAECSACAALQARHKRLAGGLGALANDLRTVEAPAHVEASLRSMFRSAHAATRSRRTAWWKTPVFAWGAASIAAASLVIGLWLAPKRREPAPVSHHNSPAQVELASLAPGEVSDGFIQLPNAPQLDPNDDVNVVRMELPRSAMLAVGLEVSPEQVAGTVEAEVMLGPDGLARAVRFMD
jgi:anti-sigma factor RsiW